MSEETLLDFAAICRSCLNNSVDLNVIFTNGFNDLLLACTDIEIFVNDGLPNQICNMCVIQLNNAFEFKKKCESNDLILRDYAHRHNIEIFRDIHPPVRPDNIKEENDEYHITIKPEITFVEAQDDPLNAPEFYDDFKHNECPSIKNECFVEENDYEGNAKTMDSQYILENDGNVDDNYDEDDEDDNDDDDDDEDNDDIYMENDDEQNHQRAQFSNRTSPKNKKNGTVYKLSEDGKYICEICNRKLADKKGLTLHMRLHTGDKLKMCTICNRGFSKNNHLQKHMQSHNRNISCKYCSDHFTSFADYRKHLLKHDTKNIRKKRKRSKSNNETSTLAAIRNTSVDELVQNTIKDYLLGDRHDEIHADCKICDKKFTKIYELRHHILNSHLVPESFNNINFESKMYLFDENLQTNNFANGDRENIIQYIIDQIKISNVTRFYQIIGKNCNEKDLSDSETDTDGESVNSLNKIKNIHSCSKCNQGFDRYYKILKHLEDEHQNDDHFNQFQCNDCKKFYPNNLLFMRHTRNQCQNVIKKFACDICHLKFMWETSLNKHNEVYHRNINEKREEQQVNTAMETRPKEKNQQCDICSKTFQRPEHLERHRRIHNPSEKKFECTVCEKKFNRKDNLRSHMRVHKTDKEELDKHLCVYCGRSFSNSSNLIVHMRRHTGEKPYKCDICDKGFPRSSDLQCHRRTHTGEKPCLCTICGKGFSRSNKLVRHMRIHTGIRPYECTYCDRSFTQSNDLTLHIRRHTGEKPYVCGVCGDRFIQGTALKQHQKLTGHVEDPTKPSPFASISVNNPSRFTNANRVNRIGMNDQSTSNDAVLQVSDGAKPSSGGSNKEIQSSASTSSNISTNTTALISESTPTQPRVFQNFAVPAGYITANGSFMPNNGVLMQNVELSTFLSLSHYNHGFNN